MLFAPCCLLCARCALTGPLRVSCSAKKSRALHSQGPPVLVGAAVCQHIADVPLPPPCSRGSDSFLEVLLGTTYACHFFWFFLLFPFFLSWASSLGCKNAVYFPKLPSLSVEVPCFCKAIWTGSLQIPRAQAWLPACPCRAPVPEMDLSPFPPSAFLPF